MYVHQLLWEGVQWLLITRWVCRIRESLCVATLSHKTSVAVQRANCLPTTLVQIYSRTCDQPNQTRTERNSSRIATFPTCLRQYGLLGANQSNRFNSHCWGGRYRYTSNSTDETAWTSLSCRHVEEHQSLDCQASRIASYARGNGWEIATFPASFLKMKYTLLPSSSIESCLKFLTFFLPSACFPWQRLRDAQK